MSFSSEFYVGSLMAVTFSDSCSPHPNKLSRFVRINYFLKFIFHYIFLQVRGHLHRPGWLRPPGLVHRQEHHRGPGRGVHV